MRNTYKVTWSNEAVNGLKDIIMYLEHDFSERDVRKFISKLENQLNLIAVNPKVFKLVTGSKSVRRMIVERLTNVYYRIEGESVHILSIFDVRKNSNSYK